MMGPGDQGLVINIIVITQRTERLHSATFFERKKLELGSDAHEHSTREPEKQSAA